MAQSTTTTTPPNPTPPTNMSFTGAQPPNPPNYTKVTMNDPANWGTGTRSNPPPYFDDGTAGALSAFATNTAALASGSGATAGGTGMPTAVAGGSYPWPFYPPSANPGDTPASSSVAHEGGTIVLTTYPGNRQYTYVGAVTHDMSIAATIAPPNWNFSPNQVHASSLSPATNPALASIAPTTAVSGASGTDAIVATGTNFTPQSVMYANGVAMPTTFTSATSVTGTVRKKTSAGPWNITVVTGGVVTTLPQVLTYS